jgi:tRNA pseudouridine38-40 synthase
MRTIKLTLEYDGTDFVGWQHQENGRSIQATVESGLAQILQTKIRIVGAGRTDSGVHARGQIASFKTESSLHCGALARSLNGVLPDDVAVLDVEEAPEDFNARYSAKARHYQYVISTVPTALGRRFAWSMDYKLDLALMKGVAERITGEHDFTSFCKAESEVAHHRCRVADAHWTKKNSTILFDITADRFLHGMVRALVGTMVEIGRGYRQIDQFGEILNGKDRSLAGMAAPPRGLFLTDVTY